VPTLEDADSALPADGGAAAAATEDEELAALLHEEPAGPAEQEASSSPVDEPDADGEPDADDAADPDDEGGADDAEDDAITFADLGLPPELLDAVTRMGFVTPTPIQAEAIPALLSRRDVVGIAQTGTGKTAAFGLPLLAGIDPAERDVQALVLAPTRELAMQSAQAMEDFAQRSRDVDIVAVYGGAPYGPQLGALRRGAQVVVGTPGRIIDLIERGALDLSRVRMLVLDEADEMLRMGFAEDVETIASSAPKERLTALFSATMPAQIERVANTHLHDPLKIAVSEESSTVDTIHQTYAVVPFKHKSSALARVLSTRDADAVLVFVRTRSDVEDIALDMANRGFRAAGISGDVAQKERERMVERLRDGSLDVLVATDVAARGLDVERIGLVVNYDVPREAEAYVHRIGRTGRAGREGRSLTFFTPREKYRLRRIESLTGTPMEEVRIPSPAQVAEFRARRVLDRVPARASAGGLDLYHTLLAELHEASDLGIADIAAALLAQAVGDVGGDAATRRANDRRGEGRIRHEEEVDENGEFLYAAFEGHRDAERGRGRDRGGRDRFDREDRDGRVRRGGARPVGSGTGRRYRVEVGRKDGVRPGAIVGAITGEGGVNGKDLGRIDIFPTFSLVEISGGLSEDATARISKARVSGRALRIHEDRGPGAGRDHGHDRGHHEDERAARADASGRPGRHDRFDRGERFDRGDRRFGGSRGERRPRRH
jgi:ATP-dependent RNA helicase DeaD